MALTLPHQRQRLRWMAALAVGLGARLGTSLGAEPPAPPYTLQGTEVLPTPWRQTGRQYEAFVSLPRDYASSSRRYPVLYVTDANYAFPLIRAIAARVNDHGVGLQDFILVGLSYAQGESGADSRNRDYTLAPLPAAGTSSARAAQPGYGQAAAYLAFVQDEVMPLIERRYRTDPERRIYVGHSYGSLLGLQALFSSPGLFSHYILGSPSLWYDHHTAFDLEQAHARRSTALPARVRLFVGQYEAARPGRPRYNKDTDLVADLQRFAAQLRARRHAGLDLQVSVLPDEDHATVFPALLTRGLMWALPR